MSKIKKRTFFSFLLAVAIFAQFLIFNPAPVVAESSLWSGQEGLGQETEIKNTFGGETDPQMIAARIIKNLLGFLGIIFLGLLIWGGWKYMLSRGNEEEVENAMKIIKNAVIGLFIVLAAWAIADYITDCVMDITTGDTIWMCK